MLPQPRRDICPAQAVKTKLVRPYHAIMLVALNSELFGKLDRRKPDAPILKIAPERHTNVPIFWLVGRNLNRFVLLQAGKQALAAQAETAIADNISHIFPPRCADIVIREVFVSPGIWIEN